jgi:molybdopterin/thiamine biosynthesis adenylyltransferase
VTDERYKRHSLIDWFSQDKVSATRVVVVGAGAVGNEVIKNLALLGVGEIHIYDFDTIENHNLTKSVLFRESDIGKLKSDTAAARAADLDPNIKVVPHAGDFWESMSCDNLQSADLVFSCVDNFEARIKLNKLCYLQSVNFVNVGIDSRFVSVEKYPFANIETVSCLECSLPGSVYARVAERYSCGWLRKVSYIERKIPTTIITSSMGAALAVSWGMRMGSKDKDDNLDLESSRLFVDTIRGYSQIVNISKGDACPCCGLLKPAISRLRASGEINETFEALLRDLIREETIWTSDPILTGYWIRVDEMLSEFQPVFERASAHTDQFPTQVAVDPNTVLVEIKDQFTITELVERFSGRKIPAKFLTMRDGADTIMVELT